MVDLSRERVGIVPVRVEDVEIRDLKGIARAGGRMGNRLHHAVKGADAALRNQVAGKRGASPLGVGREWIEDVRLDIVVVQDLAEVAGEHLWRRNIIFVK